MTRFFRYERTGFGWRLISPDPNYVGAARKEWQIFFMLHSNSMFSHLIFSGTFRECIEMIGEIDHLPAY